MLIIFLAANALLFMTQGVRHEVDFWACYGFVTFAYITLWGSAFRQEDSSSEYHFAITRMMVNTVYVVLAFIVAIIVYSFNLEGLWFYLPQVVVAIVFVSLMLFISDIDDTHAELEKQTKVKRSFIVESLDSIDSLMILCDDEMLKRRLSLIQDLLMSSQSSVLDVELESESIFETLIEKLRRSMAAGSIEDCLNVVSSMEKALSNRDREIQRQRSR